MTHHNEPSASLFLAATSQGVVAALHTAQDEWAVDHALSPYDVRCLAADPLNPSVIYAGTQGQGVLRSENRGATWEPAGLDGRIIKSLAVSRTEPGTVYAGTKPAWLFVSRDSGATWSELEGFRHVPGRWYWLSPAEKPFNAYVQGIALSPTDPQVIIAGIEAGAVVRSSDGGQTWSGHRKGAMIDCHSLTFHPTVGDYVYEGGGSGKAGAFSHDAGATWKQSKPGWDHHCYGWAVAADPANPETWYVSASSSPFKAHRPGNADAYIFRVMGGDTWEKVGAKGGLPQPLDHMPYALQTDASAPGHLYAGLINGDVWFTPDYGDSWRQLPFNLGPLKSLIVLS
jgi:photosystem II stability/assembly factor-like uncharacterized protein